MSEGDGVGDYHWSCPGCQTELTGATGPVIAVEANDHLREEHGCTLEEFKDNDGIPGREQ